MSEKEALMDMKDFEEEDYRGLVAIGTLVILGLSLVFSPEHAKDVMILAGSAFGYYFGSKSAK